MKPITQWTIRGLVVVALLGAVLGGVWMAGVAQANGGPGRGGPGGDATVLNAAAQALGMTATDLTTALRGGQTLSQIAQARNVNPDTVEQAIVAAKKAELDQLSASLDLNGLFAALGGGGPRDGGPGRPGETPRATRVPAPTRTPTP